MIVRHWVGMVMENEAGPEGFGCDVAEKADFFYAYDRLITSTNPV